MQVSLIHPDMASDGQPHDDHKQGSHMADSPAHRHTLVKIHMDTIFGEKLGG